MATRYAFLARSVRVSELSERDVLAALLSRGECASLLERIAGRPSDRSATRALLVLLGRLATPACTWLEGELAVELFEDDGTKVCVMSEIGAGLRERVLPAMTLATPLADVVAMFEKRRELTAVLRLERVSARCVLLLASAGEEESAPMSMEFDISETSLSWPMALANAGANLEEVDSGWDDAPFREPVGPSAG